MAAKKSSEPIFYDARFRQKRKQGQYSIVEAPQLEGKTADAHTHLQSLRKPEIALARCALHRVGFLCTVVDVYEDGSTTFDLLDSWRFDGLRIAREFVGWT